MLISSTLRGALKAKVPSANFTPYFAFLESLPVVETGHKHHILPRKVFPEFAKDPSNLIRVYPADHFRAHYWLAVCASDYEPFQVVFYLMANKRRARQIDTVELSQYAEVYERGRTVGVEISRKNGCNNVESGLIFKIATPESCSRGGKIGGRRNVESGQLASITGMGGKIGGRTQGRRNAENGHLAALTASRTHEELSAAGRFGGYKTAEKGYLIRAGHIRWHVKRGIIGPSCALCSDAQKASTATL